MQIAIIWKKYFSKLHLQMCPIDNFGMENANWSMPGHTVKA